MKNILVVGEDSLCCALGERLIASAMPGWTLTQAAIDKKGRSKLQSAIGRYAEQARHVQPVLCIGDTDGECPVDLCKEWLGGVSEPKLLLRFAVSEAESWVLADRAALAEFLEIAVAKIPVTPDMEDSPKEIVLGLARKSKRKIIRDEMVSPLVPTKQGSGYNFHLSDFVRTCWDASRAAQNSPSLCRAVKRLKSLVDR